jgi:hypothetical protein
MITNTYIMISRILTSTILFSIAKHPRLPNRELGGAYSKKKTPFPTSTIPAAGWDNPYAGEQRKSTVEEKTEPSRTPRVEKNPPPLQPKTNVQVVSQSPRPREDPEPGPSHRYPKTNTQRPTFNDYKGPALVQGPSYWPTPPAQSGPTAMGSKGRGIPVVQGRVNPHEPHITGQCTSLGVEYDFDPYRGRRVERIPTSNPNNTQRYKENLEIDMPPTKGPVLDMPASVDRTFPIDATCEVSSARQC